MDTGVHRPVYSRFEASCSMIPCAGQQFGIAVYHTSPLDNYCSVCTCAEHDHAKHSNKDRCGFAEYANMRRSLLRQFKTTREPVSGQEAFTDVRVCGGLLCDARCLSDQYTAGAAILRMSQFHFMHTILHLSISTQSANYNSLSNLRADPDGDHPSDRSFVSTPCCT
jgi:hypothetical protein